MPKYSKDTAIYMLKITKGKRPDGKTRLHLTPPINVWEEISEEAPFKMGGFVMTKGSLVLIVSEDDSV